MAVLKNLLIYANMADILFATWKNAIVFPSNTLSISGQTKSGLYAKLSYLSETVKLQFWASYIYSPYRTDEIKTKKCHAVLERFI